MVKLAYDEDSEQYYVRWGFRTFLHFHSVIDVSFYLNDFHFGFFLGNESRLKEETDETVWIFPWVKLTSC